MFESIKEILTYMLHNPFYGVIVVLGFSCMLFYPSIMGFFGELWVKIRLVFLNQGTYRILNDILIDVDGSTHQMDHIILSKFGIFVIETKNYSGKIYGKEFSDKWVQHIGRNKYYFHSPIKQNYGHIKSLEQFLKIPNDRFISIVTFSNQAKLKVTSKTHVVNLEDLLSTIKKYRKEILLEHEVDNIYFKLLKANITDKKIRRQHVKNIKKNLRTR